MPAIPDSLRALLAGLIDYAGLFPPAALPLDEVVRNYRDYLDSPEAWMLNRLVLPFARLNEVPAAEDWRITVLVDAEPGSLPASVETLETKLPHRLSLPTYCEAPLDAIEGAFAKIRTGGLKAEAVPTSGTLADFLYEAAGRRTPFKATAGLHHPIRSWRALTYEAGSECATVHGFVNVFAAAAFAWRGAAREQILAILDETEAPEFDFGEGELRCRAGNITTADLLAARREFAHSFGSCSFTEPVAGLRALGWLP